MTRGSLVRLLTLAVVWGSGFLWIKLALRGFTPMQIVLVRLALGVVVLAPVVLHQRVRLPTGWRIWLHLLVAALLANVLPYTLFGIGEQAIGSSTAGLLNATTPLWTLLVAFTVGVERIIKARHVVATAFGLAGTTVILAPWKSFGDIATAGGLICLAASASYGVSYVYMGRYLTGRGISPMMLSMSQLAAGTLLVGLAMPFDGLAVPSWQADAVASLLILGVVGTGLAYVLNYRLIDDEGPTVASTTTYLLPVVAAVLGAAVLDEPVTVQMIFGAVLVLTGVALARGRPTNECRPRRQWRRGPLLAVPRAGDDLKPVHE